LFETINDLCDFLVRNTSQEHCSWAVLRVQDNSRRHHGGRNTTECSRSSKRWVIYRREGYAIVFFEIAGNLRVVVAHIDAQHGAQLALFQILLDPLSVSDFCATRCAPLSPGV